MAKTLIEIDADKLARVQEILGAKTKRETVDRALDEVIRIQAARDEMEWLKENAARMRKYEAELDSMWRP
ncbi:MAG: type II toxin-antitoxin system VapB family antitoxin [Actinomycetes bacterium]